MILVLSFTSRTIFIQKLGADYLGIEGLFTNVLQVLSAAELGLGAAMSYAMYAALRAKDEVRLAGILHLYRKVYRIVAVAVTVLGLSLLPLLPFMINTANPVPGAQRYFLYFLANTVVTYLAADKVALFIADQRMYVVRVQMLVFEIARTVTQILILTRFANYDAYLVTQTLSTVLYSIMISIRAKRSYGSVFARKDILPPEERGAILRDTRSLAVYRIGGIVLNDSTNILISTMISTTVVGLYSNYLLLIGTIRTLTDLVFSSVQASIGNLNADSERDPSGSARLFPVLHQASMALMCFTTVSLFTLLNPFILVWLGPSYLFSTQLVVVVVATFWLLGAMTVVTIYRETTGIFRKTKYTILVAAAINLVLAIVLGRTAGLIGILSAAIIARLVSTFWYEPMVLFRDRLGLPLHRYFIDTARHALATIAAILVIQAILHYVAAPWPKLIVGSALALLISPLAFIAFNFRDPAFKQLWRRFSLLVSRTGR